MAPAPKKTETPKTALILTGHQLENTLLALNLAKYSAIRTAQGDGHEYFYLILFTHNQQCVVFNIRETPLMESFIAKFLSAEDPLDFRNPSDKTVLLNFRKLLFESKSYEQHIAIRDLNNNITNIKDFKVSQAIINALPEHLRSKLHSVIQLGYNLRYESNQQNQKAIPKTSLFRFPDLVDETMFHFKFKNKGDNDSLLDCLPISEWVIPQISKRPTCDFDTPVSTPVKKVKGEEDL